MIHWCLTVSPSGQCRSLDGHNKVETRHLFEDEQHTVTCLKFIIRCNTKVFCEWCVELLMLCALLCAQHSVLGSQIQYMGYTMHEQMIVLHHKYMFREYLQFESSKKHQTLTESRVYTQVMTKVKPQNTGVFWIALPTSYLCEGVHEGPAKHKESQGDGIILYKTKKEHVFNWIKNVRSSTQHRS